MKTISKLFVAVSMTVAGLSSANAQNDYLLNYGPGSPTWCWQMQQEVNAIGMQNTIMQMQIVDYYQQQAAAANQWMQTNPFQPMPGVMTYDGVYVTPQTITDYHKEQVDCEHCDGGYNYRTVYSGMGQTHQVKTKCTWCHGDGYVTRTVKNN